MKPRYFKSAADFRAWLAANGSRASELWVGFYKKASGKGGITYQESVDAALCFGWIDGIKKRVDEHSYTHRFTPRRARSTWSRINTRRMPELIAAGLMAPAGLEAFQQRDERRTAIYTYENEAQALAPPLEKRFKANRKAWEFFQAQPPGYRKLVTRWIGQAKKDETRLKRLQMTIDASAKGTRTRWM